MGSVDDFDFNDMVMGISSITEDIPAANEEEEGTTVQKLVFTPLAAGGTLPLYIHFVYKGTDYVLKPGVHDLTGTHDLSTATGDEFHSWLGAMSSTMTNTGYYTTNVKRTCTLIVDEDFNFALDESESFKSIDGNVYKAYFYVTVNKPEAEPIYENVDPTRAQDTSYSVGLPVAGTPCQSFIIWAADGWQWPTERQHIASRYPGFKKWVQDHTYDWITNPEGVR